MRIRARGTSRPLLPAAKGARQGRSSGRNHRRQDRKRERSWPRPPAVRADRVRRRAQLRGTWRPRPSGGCCRPTATARPRGRAKKPSGLGGAALHVGDVGGDHLRAVRSLLHVAGNFLRRRALLFHGGRDRGGNLGKLADGARDFLDGADRLLGRRLDTGDLLADLAGGLGGLFGQRLHFGGDDRKATAGFTGAGRLDGGIEREQIGLARDGVDEFDHVADAGGGLRQFADPIVGSCGPDPRRRWPSARIPAPAG